MKYFCYTLTIEKERRYELEDFFNQVFFDTDYEIISDVSEVELTSDFGEIYDDVVTEYANFCIRFYVRENMQSSTTRKLKKAPQGTFIEKSELDFDEEEVLETYKHSFMLTDKVQIIFDKTMLEPTQKNIVQIILPPKNAFGTGTHPTTKLATMFLAKKLTKKSRVIDVGTGTGILAVYAAKLGVSKVLAVDSDVVAVNEAKMVAQDNNVASVVQIEQNNFLDGIAVKAYTFVVANLSLNLYELFLPDFVKQINKRHRIIFSGIMEKEDKAFRKLLQKQQLEVKEIMQEDGWIAYYVYKK